MMAYAHLYEPPCLTLLHPHHEGLRDNEGVQVRFRITGQPAVLETASVHMADGKDLVTRLQRKRLPEIMRDQTSLH